MKYRTFIDSERAEEVLIYAHSRTRAVEEIESFVSSYDTELFGYTEGGDAVKISHAEVEAFTVEGGRVFALLGNQKLRLKERLFAVEAMLDDSFVRINQSCIGNLRKIARFKTTAAGALSVTFKCGFVDYVSRRQLKNIKERIKSRYE